MISGNGPASARVSMRAVLSPVSADPIPHARLLREKLSVLHAFRKQGRILAAHTAKDYPLFSGDRTKCLEQ